MPEEEPLARPGPELLKALEHPMRFHLLGMVVDREASPNELAKRLGEPVGNVAYHVRRLRDLGAVRLVRTAQRRGAIEHFYRAAVRPWLTEEEMAALSPAQRRTSFASTVGRIATRALGAVPAGSFDRSDAAAVFIPLQLDDDAYAEAIGLVEELVERLVALQDAGEARVADGAPDTRTRYEASILMYAATPPGSPPGAPPHPGSRPG